METPKKYPSLFGDMTADEVRARIAARKEAKAKEAEEKAKQETEKPT